MDWIYVDTFNAAAQLCWATIDGRLLDISELKLLSCNWESFPLNPMQFPPRRLFYFFFTPLVHVSEVRTALDLRAIEENVS